MPDTRCSSTTISTRYVFPVQPTFLENMQYRYSVLLEGAEILRGSTQHKDDLRRQVLAIMPDYVVHLAALPLANVAISHTEEAFDCIVQGTVNMLEILRDTDYVKRFVYVSSSMAYGNFTQFPMPEEGSKDPIETYGGMKLAGEILVKVFSQRYDIAYTIVRPSAVYGPTDNNRRVLQVFVESAIAGRPFVAKNPETTLLDFTYVEDLAQGLMLATLSENGTNEDFNLTRGEGRSLAEAVQILNTSFPDMSYESRSEPETFRPDRGTLDISKARRLLGYEPEYPLELGLQRYADFVETNNRSLHAAAGRR